MEIQIFLQDFDNPSNQILNTNFMLFCCFYSS